MRQRDFYRRTKAWVAAGYPVRGHTCEGLLRLQSLLMEWPETAPTARECSFLRHCTPNIQPDGHIAGCDDWNITRIEFCPMCGERLVGTGLEWEDEPDSPGGE